MRTAKDLLEGRPPREPHEISTETRERGEGDYPTTPPPASKTEPLVNRGVTSPPPSGPWRTLAVKVPRAAAEALEREALERGRTISTHLRGLLLAHLNEGPVVESARPPTPTPEAPARSIEEARRVLALPLPPGERLARVARLLGAKP
jgi:hypothetical protein